MITAPTNCPSCDSVLSWSNDQLYCRNNDCPAKSFKQVEHFAKTLKIKGLGPSTIEKLGVTAIADIYDMDVAFIELQLNSERLAIKLFEEIEKSKQQPLNTVLPAFGIPLVGKSATDKLSAVCDSIFDIDEQTCKAAGLGNVATTNLIEWLALCFEKYENLPFSFEFDKVAQSTKAEVVCITGKLKSFATKAAAKEALESKGFGVKDSITKEVTILVNESGVETAKTKKAADSGVTIINNLKDYLENIE